MSIEMADHDDLLVCTDCGEGFVRVPMRQPGDEAAYAQLIADLERSHGQCCWDNEGDDTMTITDMKPRTVYAITYHCQCEDGDGEMEAFWTGEIDAWGKRTFRPVDGSPEVYLFDHEIGLIAE